MKRNEFLRKSLFGAVIAIPVLPLITGCANDSEPSPLPPTTQNPTAKNCLENGTSSNIGNNHGHSLTVSKTDVEAGVEKSYAIMGSSSHNHEVIITSTHFGDLKNNKSIQVESSSTSGHMHSITVSCA